MVKTSEELPQVGTDEWNKLNRRRAELIHKKNRQGLSSEEQCEYEKLQLLSQEALEQAYPAPSSTTEAKLDELEAKLRDSPDADSE